MIAPFLDDQQWQHFCDELAKKQTSLRLACCDSECYARESKLGTRHFVHIRNAYCSSMGETLEHLIAKELIAVGAKDAGWQVDVEVEGDGWRADVLAELGKNRVAFEVQWSSGLVKRLKTPIVKNCQEQFIKRLAKLRVDRSKGVAPHKPLLLLVIIELAKSNLLTVPTLKLTPDLAFRFSVYWSIIAHRRSQLPDVRLPFHHVSSDRLWPAFTNDGELSKHRDSTASVTMTDEFYAALQSTDFRQQAGYTLISNDFEHAEQIALYELAGINPPEGTTALDDLAVQADKESRAEGQTARFRVDVVAAYCHTCALTGYRITTITGHSIVDATHIHQFARSRKDDPQNGISLCKNAHWLFELGLWSINDD